MLGAAALLGGVVVRLFDAVSRRNLARAGLARDRGVGRTSSKTVPRREPAPESAVACAERRGAATQRRLL